MQNPERQIQLAQQLVDSTTEGDPRRAEYLSKLGTALGVHFEHIGRIQDLEEAISVTRQASDLVQEDHPDRTSWLNSLGVLLLRRYGLKKAKQDLEDAIRVVRLAVDFTPEGHPDRSFHLNTLGVILEEQYEQTKAIQHLQEAIDVAQQAVDSVPEDDPDRAGYLSNLGNKLGARYGRTGLVQDLEAAINATRQAAESTAKDHPDRPACLTNLGIQLKTRFQRTGRLQDLDEATSIARQAVESGPKGHSVRVPCLNTLGGMLKTRYERTKQLQDLDETIDVAQQVVACLPQKHPLRAPNLSNLEYALSRRYVRTRNIEDLDEAIRVAREVLDLTPDDDPRRAASVSSLDRKLRHRFDRTGVKTDFYEAVRLTAQTRLCDACILMFHGTVTTSSSKKRQFYPHYEALKDLKLAAEAQCQMCFLLWSLLSEPQRAAVSQVTPAMVAPGSVIKWLVDISPTDSKCYIVIFYFKTPKKKGPKEWEEIMKIIRFKAARGTINADIHEYVSQPVSDIEPHFGRHATKMRANTWSDASRTLSCQWLKQCVEEHTECGNNSACNWYPTRLIDVGSINDEAHPRLVMRSEGVFEGHYLSLSHCWGSSQLRTLTKAAFEELKTQIPLASLPQTFQDAIVVTRHMGVRWLWIDSLCIMQDSVEDWTRESSLMGEIYKNALCNISATGATDRSVGLFLERETKLVKPFKVHLEWKGPLGVGPFYCYDQQLWMEGVDGGPVNRRAWVVQERFLAKRVLHFCEKQIFWECREMTACELYPKGVPDTSLEWLTGSWFKRSNPVQHGELLRKRGQLEPNDGLNAYHWWGSIVDSYTACKLTKEEDKLVAISGLAKYMRSFTDDEYLAGLWKKHLIYHIQWATFKAAGNELHFRPQTYRAPSWSWASIEGPVLSAQVIHSDFRDTLATVVDANVSTITEDTTIQVTDGFIHLKGAAFNARWRKGKSYPSMDVIVGDKTFSISCLMDEGFEFPTEVISCVPMRVGKMSGFVSAQCLVLGPVSTNGKIEYKRLALFHSMEKDFIEFVKDVAIKEDHNIFTLV